MNGNRILFDRTNCFRDVICKRSLARCRRPPGYLQHIDQRSTTTTLFHEVDCMHEMVAAEGQWSCQIGASRPVLHRGTEGIDCCSWACTKCQRYVCISWDQKYTCIAISSSSWLLSSRSAPLREPAVCRVNYKSGVSTVQAKLHVWYCIDRLLRASLIPGASNSC